MFLAFCLLTAALVLVARWMARQGRGSNAPAGPLTGNEPPHHGEPHARLKTKSWCDYQIVGESHYQDALEEICGGKEPDGAKYHCTAFVASDPGNRYDPNAIEVRIEGALVGYFDKDAALACHKELQQAGKSSCRFDCPAFICGGWDDGETEGSFGVKLGLVWPPQVDGAL